MNMNKMITFAAVMASAILPSWAGQTVYWQQSASGGYNWNDSANWNTALDGSGEAVVPGEGDTLDFTKLVGIASGNPRVYYFTNDIPNEVQFAKCVNIFTNADSYKRLVVWFDKGLFWFDDQNSTEFHYLRVGADAKLKATKLSLERDSGVTHNAFVIENHGELEVTAEMTYGISPCKYKSYLCHGGMGNNGVVRAEKLVYVITSASGAFYLSHSADTGVEPLVLGAGGVQFRFVESPSNRPYFRVEKNKSAIIGASADCTIGKSGYGTGDDADCILYLENASSVCTFDTSDYDGRLAGVDIPRNITFEGRSYGIGKLVVKGCGSFLFATNSLSTGGLTVNESATVAMDAGCTPGNGAVTLNGTSTLKVAQSGTVTLGGNLTIANGAALAFNFTDRTATPILALASGKTVTAAGTVKVKVSKSEDMKYPATASGLITRKLTSGFGLAADTSLQLVDKPGWVSGVAVVDGDIVLTLKARGFMLIVK